MQAERGFVLKQINTTLFFTKIRHLAENETQYKLLPSQA
jgi:hypothetical protein